MSDQARPKLTPMQWLVLERLAAGDTNAAITRSLGIGLPTVASHLTAIYQRLPHANRGGKRAAAVAWYLREGRTYREEASGPVPPSWWMRGMAGAALDDWGGACRGGYSPFRSSPR